MHLDTEKILSAPLYILLGYNKFRFAHLYNKVKMSLLQTQCNRGPKIINYLSYSTTCCNLFATSQIYLTSFLKKQFINMWFLIYIVNLIKKHWNFFVHYWIWRKDFYISIYIILIYFFLKMKMPWMCLMNGLYVLTQWSKLSVGNASESEISRF